MFDKDRGILELANAEVNEKMHSGLFRRKSGLPDYERGIHNDRESKHLSVGYVGQGPRR
jgi:hypothetical protein